MKRVKNILIVVSVFSIISFLMMGCTNSQKSDNNKMLEEAKKIQEVTIQEYNIMIAPDLSNRINDEIHPKPVDDRAIIHEVFQMIPTVLTSNNRTTGQKDLFSFMFVNSGLISQTGMDVDSLRIDFSSFVNPESGTDNQKNRIEYIKNRNPERSLKKDVVAINNRIEKLYSFAQSHSGGADIWSFLNSEIDPTILKTQTKRNEVFGGVIQNIVCKNVMILLTDGYLESGLSRGQSQGEGKNMSYDLTQSRIRDFRNAFKHSKMNDLRAFYKKEGYGIVALKNSALKDLHLLVMEMDDRSQTKTGNATVFPTDAEIINLFWTDWLKRSGVATYELHHVVPSKSKAQKIIRNFLEV
ncbi:hypothetical protein K4L44_06525 [Halosquirtibacter laminarini]|uniref:Uncharacterized protein n=1 Tax=Halosquirtibacter laminarini TaxID=3374600 RepID=A0AC61NM95_9BACT|nr:hypothetical protein K4L44_06525 [Prolixibacteraceae bacterium]